MENLEANEKIINIGGQNLRDIIISQEEINDSDNDIEKTEEIKKPLLEFLYSDI